MLRKKVNVRVKHSHIVYKHPDFQALELLCYVVINMESIRVVYCYNFSLDVVLALYNDIINP